MLSVMLEKEFLSTDPQFGDQPAILDWSDFALGALLISVIVTGVLSLVFEAFPSPLPALIAKIAMGMSIVGGLVFMITASQMSISYSDTKREAQEVAKENLIVNIQSVYDVELIKGIDSYYTSPDNKPELLVIQDDVGYEVILKQNPETYEPTLVLISSPDSEITELRKK